MRVDRGSFSRVSKAGGSQGHRPAAAAALLLSLVLGACGGGGGSGAGSNSVASGSTGTSAGATGNTANASDSNASTDGAVAVATAAVTTRTGSAALMAPGTANQPRPTTVGDAVRLADQATFGPTEASIVDIQAKGASAWLISQMIMPPASRYTSGGDGSIHQTVKEGVAFCEGREPDCWRDRFSAEPLLWDFYRNAVKKPDQLRQRVAFALQQILVINNMDVQGTYGFRNYYNTFLDNAFGNYRDVLRKVTLSPIMGDFLNNVNNLAEAPNENYARELLQLFSIGPCKLNSDGSLVNGQCEATYSNETVRNYAYALTGWTFPAGGSNGYGCFPGGTNCRYYGGDMVPMANYHDNQPRALLSNVTLPTGHTAPDALEKVLDSVMNHPNIAPFIAKRLIQHLVSSNPTPAYVQRVATAFRTGRYGDFGRDHTGDLDATVAAVLLDSEARGETVSRNAGKLREPVLMFTGVLRALNGQTDGDALSWWWGKRLRQHMFRPPSVFNYFPPTNPVAGTDLNGPEFAIHEASTALERLNFLTYLIEWEGSTPNPAIPNATGTTIDLSPFMVDINDSTKLVDRFSTLLLGRPLQGAARTSVIDAVAWWNLDRAGVNWQKCRVKSAVYMILASPQYQVQR